MAHRQILVVDDSAEVAFILGHIGRRAGWDIINQRNAEQAETFLRQNRPDVVLLDVNLPGANGYEFCRLIKGDQRLRDLTIAMFSQWQRSEDIIRALAAGTDFVVSKDLLARPSECRDRLAEILRWAADHVLPFALAWQTPPPTVRSLVERFNRTLREVMASRLGIDLLRALLDRTAFEMRAKHADAARWLPGDPLGLDAEHFAVDGHSEAVVAFVTAFAEQGWRVAGTRACIPFWQALARKSQPR